VVFPAVSLPRIVADSNETLANITNQTYIGFPIDPTYDVSWIGKLFQHSVDYKKHI
jgi:hypothetical protein